MSPSTGKVVKIENVQEVTVNTCCIAPRGLLAEAASMLIEKSGVFSLAHAFLMVLPQDGI